MGKTLVKSEKTIVEFCENDVPAYGSFDTTRKLQSYIDGLKTSQRKLLFTMRKKHPNEFIKTENFANETANETQYLHGAANLTGVASLMAQSFVGANSYPYFLGNSGGFGCRLNPVFSAPRYTRVTMNPKTAGLWNEKDDPVLEKQFFEGSWIEPKYFVPVLPAIFLNMGEGLSIGFAETVYPRNPKDLIKYIKTRLRELESGDKTFSKTHKMKLIPWFRNHRGEVRWNAEKSQWESAGCVEVKSSTLLEVTELPIGLQYFKYVETLDKLCDDGLIINYEDKCDTKNDSISFMVKVNRAFLDGNREEKALVEALKLVKGLPENFCFIDENNRVREFKDVYEVLDAYIPIRIKTYEARKENSLQELKGKITRNYSKYLFCRGIVDETIIVAKKTKADIEAQLDKVDKIIRIDGSYGYLLSMPIHSISKETLEELKKTVTELKDQYTELKGKTVAEMWEEDIAAIEKNF